MTFDILIARVRTREQQRFNMAMDIMEANTIAAAPVDSGFLQTTIGLGLQSFTPTSFGREILVDAVYAAATDTGSRPYRISTRTAQVLSDGENFFGTEVQHPGLPGTLWFTDGVATQEVWANALQQAGAGLAPIGS